ncbi:MAG: PIF1 family DEAD/DEAH box helicase, partial [Bacteroidales bacterium]|nr:PIF1 family DEAD/DEAH box helicase [Bacteroidales bacterium]
MAFQPNPLTTLAEHYVNDTDTSLFLTGKAGTGKTTFLRHIVETTRKRCVVLAPTGVAAINARGSTIHSFFQLPPSLFIPEEPNLMLTFKAERTFRPMRKDKLKLIETLDLVIIDEISMVRADLMDAIDDKLRTLRRCDKPFGGVQLMMIGDVHQLPPVVTAQEETLLARAYPSPFFFHSRALRKVNYVTIQLTHVHRQQDPTFVNLLNDVRDGLFSEETMRALNGRLFPNFHPSGEENYIRLTTHNRQADLYNEQQLAALHGKAHTFNAKVEGNFPISSMPTSPTLTLKVGTQVMFVRNDTSGAHRYYNGKICVVVDFNDESVIVRDIDGENIAVGMERWENLSYSMEKDGTIKQTADGSFTQYPLRLAWAVTVHKAQGLTFDHVIVDAAAAFAYGQVYVALSRCRSLEGLVLVTPITRHSAFGNDDVNSFVSGLNTAEEAHQRLAACKTEYYMERLNELFNM